ncbi:MAG: PilT/PilU family type 4a pilus ATPase [Blautia sp.]|nr:PilT/PilU family type 4a pilus ATPase [Blautia sp.]
MTSLALPDFLQTGVDHQASDIFIISGKALTTKEQGKMHSYGEKLMPEETHQYVQMIYRLAGNRSMDNLLAKGDDDFSFSVSGIARFRVNAYLQRNSLAAVIRLISNTLPNPDTLSIPEEVMSLADLTRGMVLVTGPAGSGKTTTLACLIDRINKTREGHIITLEDPLEYMHRHNKCIISQREILSDTASYLVSLRAALRQSPDVILLGEMRDHETIQTAMTAAETGHLLFSTLHSVGAANTIERIIDVFEPSHQRQITIQLADILQAVVSQQLIPDVDGRIIPVFEIMRLTPAIRNMIRDNKVHQIDGVISSSGQSNMITMDQSLANLFRQKRITRETALNYATNPELMKRKLM